MSGSTLQDDSIDHLDGEIVVVEIGAPALQNQLPLFFQVERENGSPPRHLLSGLRREARPWVPSSATPAPQGWAGPFLSPHEHRVGHQPITGA